MKRARKKIVGASQAWYERIADQLDFSADAPSIGIDPANEPAWVGHILRELILQSMPAVPRASKEGFTPRKVGIVLGQQRANFEAVANALDKMVSPKALKAAKALAKIWKEKAKTDAKVRAALEGPAMASTVAAMEWMLKTVEGVSKVAKDFEERSTDAVKRAWEEENVVEASEFFAGLAEGMKRPGISGGRPAGATTATPIYQRLLIHRREVEKFRTVKELYDFLLRVGLPPQAIGDFERLDKLCQRIGFKFARSRLVKSRE